MSITRLSGTLIRTGSVPTNVLSGSVAAYIPAGVISSSTQLPTGTVSASSQISYIGLSNIPSGIISSSTQIPALLPNGTVSASSQVVYTSLSSIPSGIVSGSTQVKNLLPTGTVSSSAQLPSGIVSSSTQIPALLPNGTISASSQVQLASITGTTFAATDYTFPNNLVVGGRLTAQEFYTELVSSSVIYESGSTKFGDTADDRHSFTGSLFVVGPVSASIFTGSGANLSNIPNGALVNSSVTVNGQSVSLGGSTTITANTTNTLTLGNGLTGTSFNGGTAVTTNVDTGSAHFTNGVTARINALGIFSSSAQVSYTSISNRPSGIVSSSTQIPALLPNGTVSASSQVVYTSLSSIPSGIVSSSTQIPALLPNGTVSASSQVNGASITNNSVSYTAGAGLSGGGSATLGGSATTINAVAGNGISLTAPTNDAINIDTGSAHFTGGVTTRVNALGIFSSSGQVNHDSTTGFVANEHIDHSTVSISAGSGLTGGGTIAATRTLTLDTGSVHFLDGVKKELNTEGVYSSSAQLVVSAYTNATDNRVVTSTGAGGINGESNLTFDGSTLTVNGALNATTKSFYIDHQRKPGSKLIYGVLEGPEHAVYVRGKLTNEDVIYLPEEWEWLVDMDTITVQLTPIGGGQKLYVQNIVANKVIVGNDNMFNKQINCYYLVHATRKDVPQLQTVV